MERQVTMYKNGLKAKSGFRKIQSLFVNNWKSGTSWRKALIASSVVVLLLASFFGGCAGKSDTLVVKGLYLGMSGDDALEVCKKIAASSKDFVVVDLRNGIEVEREVGLGEYEEKQQNAWHAHMQKRRQALSDGVAEWDLPKKGLNNYTWEGWKESHPPTEEELAASKKKIKEIVSKKNVIRISVKIEKKEKTPEEVAAEKLTQSLLGEKKVDETRADNLPGLVFVWIDDEGNVKEVFFNAKGLARLFNSGDLSTREFAKMLVKKYSGIPSLEPNVKFEDATLAGIQKIEGKIETTTWIYKDPKGYQVKLFGQVYIDENGAREELLDKRYFTFFAIKPESARKFD